MDFPKAIYSGPDGTEEFKIDPKNPRYNTTEGVTSGASDYVLNQGHTDVDKPSDPKKDSQGHYTELSKLRMHLTGLQDDINEFLTEKIGHVKKACTLNHQQEQEINDLLDGSDEI